MSKGHGKNMVKMTRYDLISAIDTSNISEDITKFALDDLFVIYYTQQAQEKLMLGVVSFEHGNFTKQKKTMFYEKMEEQ